MNDDYAKLMSVDPCCADNYTATGTAASILANRISYTFDLHGPSATIDTACSSSLFAVHLGAQSIVTGIHTVFSYMAVCLCKLLGHEIEVSYLFWIIQIT